MTGFASPRRGWILPALIVALALIGTGILLLALLSGSGGRGEVSEDTSDSSASAARTPTSPSPSLRGGSTGTRSPAATVTPQAVPISRLADATWVAETANAAGISERVMAAYAGASLAVTESHPGCGIGWNTLAAIGLVESEHGTLNGAAIGRDGVASPRIVGPALDGTDGTATIPDTDRGVLDGDTTWDHAVGPMQFIPSTWKDAATDGNGDGTADVNQIDDAALSAATYLCEVGGDLTVAENWIAAISAYNESVAYNNRVAEAADAYAGSGNSR